MDNLTYLTAQFPPGVYLPDKLAKRLNDKGIVTVRGTGYNIDVVRNRVYGKTTDEHVKPELIAWLREIYTAEELKKLIKTWQDQGTMMIEELL